MRVVDSSAWIEWLRDTALAPDIGGQLPHVASWIVPSMVLHEVAKWLGRERGDAAVAEFVAFCRTCLIVPLDERLAVMAARLAREHRLATADAIIYATTHATNADLLTCDAHFNGLDGVVYLPKSA